MRLPMLAVAILTSLNAMANEAGYRLSVEPRVQGNMLAIAPQVTGPAGAQLRYEMTVRKGSGGNSSDSRQSGTVTVDETGGATLARSSVNVEPGQQVLVTVRVYDGAKLVASESLTYPK